MIAPAAATELEAKVAFLSRPDSYPDRVRSVETIETHMAWVFLAGERAYKLKKPVRYSFLDFSTVAARRHSCHEEVRLNRRLAPDVYLDAIPLTEDRLGQLRLDGAGAPVDWLVRMRRLPRDRMLDRAVAAGTVAPAELAPAARLLADFFASATPAPLGPGELAARLRAELHENRDELARHADALPVAPVPEVAGVLERFLDQDLGLLEERTRAGRVVEGHGDLRPEHVFLGPPPAVIDCLEFNRAFRILDPADELAFLGLELERLGAPHLALPFLDAYRERTGDTPPASLLAFYAAHRALLRAKLAIWHLADHVAEPEKWVARARSYLELARAHAGRTV